MNAISAETVARHGLTEDEYVRIGEHMGREPNLLELGIFSVMWSEHCSYKSSRRHLKKLPVKAPWVITGPGENAGVIDIGDGLAAVFKMESHNHPSFIEPYQGAATGVGGIMRDIFTMGARPVANMNLLRFGTWEDAKTRHLVSGVVAGIGGYGNCTGVPTIGGDTGFHEGYNRNNLVNAMTVGIADSSRIFYSAVRGTGNPVIYAGAPTGRDGIHGATMASAEFDASGEEQRPAVQVGDPFTEKLLLEACLELMATDCIIAIQDMGAAGLTSSSVEMAAKGGKGLELDLDRVPCREDGMTPYEIMLSESQERMLMVLRPGRTEEAEAVFEKWGVSFAVIGQTTATGRLVIRHGGEIVGDMPVRPLADDAPDYDRPFVRTPLPEPAGDPCPVFREQNLTLKGEGKSTAEMERIARALVEEGLPDGGTAGFSADTDVAQICLRAPAGPDGDGTLEELARNLEKTGMLASVHVATRVAPVSLADTPGTDSLLTALAKLMRTPDLCSRRWIWEQYDHTVMGDTVLCPGGDAALVRVHGTDRGLAVSTDVTHRYVAASPREGARQAVAETYRNICATGATPLAVTNCLNFGNPERPEIMGQFAEAVEGIAEACRELDYPVVSGNVSLYNETDGTAIPPTPAIGGVGVIEDVTKAVGTGGARGGEELVAIGITRGHLDRSVYLRTLFHMEEGQPPPVDTERERTTGALIRKLVDEGLLTACHDVSDGGILVAAAEMALAGGCGLTLHTPVRERRAAYWFGEDQSRYLVASTPAATDTLLLKAAMAGIQATRIGRFGGPDILLDDNDAISLFDLSDMHESALPGYMNPGKPEEERSMPMSADEIRKLVLDAMPDAEIGIEDLAGDGDHYRAHIVSAAFNGKSRLQQHQLVYRALKGRMGGDLHALALETEARE